ncbi:dihydrofolate reductase family protein [Marinospirillum sp.]|uniref:dihydrofolate reductase family protein n=1 Tax=Marinospirillum sp. TaxID=2183934 RepID=UPI003A83E64C
MTIQCSVFIAASVDGYIATLDGGIEWLAKPEYNAAPLSGLTYEAFIASVDAIVMGRKTFEKVLSFDAWPYQGIQVVVLSSTDLFIPEQLADAVRHESGRPSDLVARLASMGMQHLYIDGGVTIQGFLKEGLIDEFTITRIPVLLGAGLPLFGGVSPTQQLTLIEAVASGNGFVQERYKVERRL